MRDRYVIPGLGAAVAVMVVGCIVHAAPAVVGAMLLLVVSVLLVPLGRVQAQIERRCRAARSTVLFGVRVHIEEGHGACTSGPLRPVILLGRGTVERLDTEELRAVVEHEAAHRRRLDPLRCALRRLVVQHVLIDPWAARAVARREVAADRAALRAGVSRPALARALLKVPTADRAAVGFGPATEQRVRALLVPGAVETRAARALAVTIGAVAGLGLCLRTGHELVRLLL